MASRKFKNQICAYCGRSDLPTTRDHVLAQQFVLKGTPIKEWPAAPACRPCNGDKADLEHYVTATAQFGGRHQDALANLNANGERRLAKNPAVARALKLRPSDTWEQRNGLWVQCGAVDFDWGRLEALCAYMAKGLAWHHWRVLLGGSACFVEVHRPLVGRPRAEYQTLLRARAGASLVESVAGDTFRYAGAQGTDNPHITAWVMQLYNGLTSPGDPDGYIGVMTGPSDIAARADLERRWRTGTRLHV